MEIKRVSRSRKAASLLLALALLLMSLIPAAAAVPNANAPESGLFPVTTYFTNIPGHPTADVPGFPGVHFEPGTGTTHFDRVFGSPNGNWIFTADTDKAAGTDEVILVNEVVKIFEGDLFPWSGATEVVGFIDTTVNINDAGDWVFATNSDGPTTSDEYIIQVSASDVYTYAIREGDPIPALPGATWGDFTDSPVIAADGTVGASSDSIQGPVTTEDDILVLGDTLLAQEGVTVPGGQLGTEFWENFDISDFFISADGTHWLVQGDLTGDTTTDDVAAVDGSVVIQEGVILPNTAFAEPVDSSGIVGVHMAPNGDWFARGNNDITEQDWVYSNGALIVASGDPIHVGATEVFTDAEFSDTFFMHVADSNGNYVIGGVSDGPTDSNGVLVANNTVVVAREGDQLDLDNDGAPDDAYFETFGNDDGFFADDGTFYVVATIKDGTGTRIGQGIFSIDLSSIVSPNTAPTLQNVAATTPINENDSTTLTGEIIDPDASDTFTMTVDWGNGDVTTYTYPAATSAFTETHQYLDDDPTATPSDDYVIALSIIDSAGGVGTASADIVVNNVAPVVDAGPDQSVPDQVEVNFNGSFSDPGTLDTHIIEWDFGDGMTSTGTLTPSHLYATDGVYTVTLTVTDDDTGSGSDTMVVTVEFVPTAVSLSSFSGSASSPFVILALVVLLPAGLLLALAYRRRYGT